MMYEAKSDWIQDSYVQKFIEKTGSENYDELCSKAAKNTEWFWQEALKDIGLDFSKPYAKVLSAGLPWPRWVEGSEISIVENCIDRHEGSRIALRHIADEPGEPTLWTYEQLARASSYTAKLLLENGAKRGDRAALLMPMSLEMVSAFFGCLRAGVTVTPIFSGYGPEAIEARLQDAEIKFVFVQDKTTRKGKEVPVKETLEKIRPSCKDIQEVFVLNRAEIQSESKTAEIIKAASLPSEAECLLLYTSGTTGKPKACVHTPFGVLATTGKEHRYSFDVKPEDRFFWYTDIGWMMGPWELFGALQFGAQVVLYEGVPDYPHPDRIWEILRDHKVTHFGISPTAIRVLKKSRTDFLETNSFEKLKILGSTGEAWDEESWLWFFKNVGKEKCPIINISGGTEIMGCLLSPTPLDDLVPTTLARPALGVDAQIWDENKKQVELGIGHLVCLSPIPSMTKGFLNSKERYLETYFEKFGDQVWYHGDWALKDENGFWFLKGRSDDTIKVAGKRVGPAEFESALMEDARVAEAAAVAMPHDIKGECVHCYVVLKDPEESNFEQLRSELRQLLVRRMGKSLAPEAIKFTESLPKTRSGKILRGIIQKIGLDKDFDASSVEQASTIEAVKRAR